VQSEFKTLQVTLEFLIFQFHYASTEGYEKVD